MAFKPPRTVFLDFPLGCPAGKPNEPELQRMILRVRLWKQHLLLGNPGGSHNFLFNGPRTVIAIGKNALENSIVKV